MTRPRFIQIHSLASYPGTLLNRDDTGQAKRLPFGGVTRARVSSQALKRKWRFAGTADHDAAKAVPYSLQGLNVPMGDRSKAVVRLVVMKEALAGLPALHASVESRIVDAINVALYGKKGAADDTRQALLFGWPETAHVASIARGVAQWAAAQPGLLATAVEPLGKASLKALDEQLKTTLDPEKKILSELAKSKQGSAGLEAALFGRMVTSDPLANVDAPVHVAHAFTVHGIERELDYVTAVDDLRQRSLDEEDADAGSAGIFDIELTSGLFYGYVVIDVNLLVSNLNGDAALAAGVAERLVQLIARTSPGAKKGSTAPYAHAEFMLVEMGDEQPRTLANAFRKAVDLRSRDLFAETMQALGGHLANLDRAYGVSAERLQLTVTPPGLEGVATASLADLCAALRTRIDSPAA